MSYPLAHCPYLVLSFLNFLVHPRSLHRLPAASLSVFLALVFTCFSDAFNDVSLRPFIPRRVSVFYTWVGKTDIYIYTYIKTTRQAQRTTHDHNKAQNHQAERQLRCTTKPRWRKSKRETGREKGGREREPALAQARKEREGGRQMQRQTDTDRQAGIQACRGTSSSTR